MFEIEVEEVLVHTATISDENEQKIRKYIKEHPEDMIGLSEKEMIFYAIGCINDINLYEDTIVSDSYTSDIRWSDFEEQTAEEIINGGNYE